MDVMWVNDEMEWARVRRVGLRGIHNIALHDQKSRQGKSKQYICKQTQQLPGARYKPAIPNRRALWITSTAATPTARLALFPCILPDTAFANWAKARGSFAAGLCEAGHIAQHAGAASTGCAVALWGR